MPGRPYRECSMGRRDGVGTASQTYVRPRAEASERANRQAGRQASKRTSKQASKQATCRGSTLGPPLHLRSTSALPIHLDCVKLASTPSMPPVPSFPSVRSTCHADSYSAMRPFPMPSTCSIAPSATRAIRARPTTRTTCARMTTTTVSVWPR